MQLLNSFRGPVGSSVGPSVGPSRVIFAWRIWPFWRVKSHQVTSWPISDDEVVAFDVLSRYLFLYFLFILTISFGMKLVKIDKRSVEEGRRKRLLSIPFGFGLDLVLSSSSSSFTNFDELLMDHFRPCFFRLRALLSHPLFTFLSQFLSWRLSFLSSSSILASPLYTVKVVNGRCKYRSIWIQKNSN